MDVNYTSLRSIIQDSDLNKGFFNDFSDYPEIEALKNFLEPRGFNSDIDNNYWTPEEFAEFITLLMPSESHNLCAEIINRLFEEITKQSISGANIGEYLTVLKLLEDIEPSKLESMLNAYFDTSKPFLSTIEKGRIDILEYLEEKSSEQFSVMIRAKNFEAFCCAAANGHLTVLKYLEEKIPSQLPVEIEVKDFAAYISAAEKGHVHVLEYLEEKAIDQSSLQSVGRRYEAFFIAAANGHLNVLEYLEVKAHYQLWAEITASNFQAFRYAATSGHLRVLEYLEEKAPNYLPSMIETQNFEAFRFAAANGHLDILEYLEEKAIPCQLSLMLGANNFEGFRNAKRRNQRHIVSYLLNFPVVLSYAERHQYEYSDVVNPFISEKLNELAAQRQAFEEESPHGVFDIKEGEVTFYFYILRNLIRRNDEMLIPQIESLLALPSLANICHVSVDAGRENDLFRLCVSLGNEYAAGVLLNNLPQVRSLAVANNYYLDEEGGAIDLVDIARDRESSMRAVSPGEKKIADAVVRHYEEAMRAFGGVDNVFEAYKAYLLEEYEKAPAIIEVNGNELVLPFDWGEFNALRLSEDNASLEYLASFPDEAALADVREGRKVFIVLQDEDYNVIFWHAETQEIKKASIADDLRKEFLKLQTNGLIDSKVFKEQVEELVISKGGESFKSLYQHALEAYYAHDAHTAYRYLSRPNYWMSPYASYVYVEDADTNLRYSTFEGYIPTIAYFWLAASDESQPSTESDCSVEDRKVLFTKQIALIGRAHNWDGFDKHGNECDDKKGDKPSCYSGVNRRLYQSVLMHPLFENQGKRCLTSDILFQELNARVHIYYTELFQQVCDEDKALIQDGVDAVLYFLEAPNAVLHNINISSAVQQQWLEVLQQRYFNQLSDGSSFRDEFIRYFELAKDEVHLIKFLYRCSLQTLLPGMEEKEEKRAGDMQVHNDERNLHSQNRVGLFYGDSDAVEGEEECKECEKINPK